MSYERPGSSANSTPSGCWRNVTTRSPVAIDDTSVVAGTRIRCTPFLVARSVAETGLQGPNRRSYVVWQWYWIDGELTSSDARAKALIAWSRLVHRKDDSAAIVLLAEDDEHQGAATLQRFVRDAWPDIAAALRRAEAAR